MIAAPSAELEARMARQRQLFPGDEELGKKDDDHRFRPRRPTATEWVSRSRRALTRRNMKRFLVGLCVLIGLYYFFKNMPTDIGPRTPRPNYGRPGNRTSRFGPGSVSQGRTRPRPTTNAEVKPTYNGPIKFYDLAESLRSISSTLGYYPVNQNVLFAASNTKSASMMLQLACDMAAVKRNNVHFTFMGRDDITMDLLKEINGVTKECNIWVHDARPDYLLESSEFRMEVSCGAALGHIDRFMHPQAIIVDNSGNEDLFFLKAMRSQAPGLEKTLIELPSNVEQSLRWITRLDSAALRVWNKVSVDVMVHAQPAASGSLIRLLTSLSRADYLQLSPPRLTIELPNKVDLPTQRFLADFRWPPSADTSSNQLILRHRIQQPGLTPEESSIRFLESFWPRDPSTAHILVLSPQVELSPIFFHYLKYLILEYKHTGPLAVESNLMGISLQTPSNYLNGTTPFIHPESTSNVRSGAGGEGSFLWQAPNSAAALYFGDRWTEIHSFIGHALVAKHQMKATSTFMDKQVSHDYPSWLKYFLTLARNRGYYMLYPHQSEGSALATVHNELFQPPEEYMKPKVKPSSASEAPPAVEELSADPAKHPSLQHKEERLATSNLLSMLPLQGVLPSLDEMPLLTWDGRRIDMADLDLEALAYREKSRKNTGQCTNTSDIALPRAVGSANDLFCFSADD